MQKILVCIGLQKTKLAECGKEGKKIIEWIGTHQSEYDGIIAIARKDLMRDNFDRMDDKIQNREVEYYDFPVDTHIEVPGYDVDCKHFNKMNEYHLIGISTSASVLCMAMSLFSNGFNIKVLTKQCCDRKSDKLHQAAIDIMKAYMPIAVI